MIDDQAAADVLAQLRAICEEEAALEDEEDRIEARLAELEIAFKQINARLEGDPALRARVFARFDGQLTRKFGLFKRPC